MSPRIPRATVSKRGSGGCDEGEGWEGRENGRIPDGTVHVAAQRILALATESLDMVRNVTGVVRDSPGCAEAYVFHFFFADHSILDGSAVYGQLVFIATQVE